MSTCAGEFLMERSTAFIRKTLLSVLYFLLSFCDIRFSGVYLMLFLGDTDIFRQF